MAILWVLLGVISGACIAVQAPINAQLGRDLGLPFAAAFVSFAAGAIVLAIVTFAVSAAIAAASNALPEWQAMPAIARARILRRAAELIRERVDEIGSVMTAEQGKPLAEAKGETDYAASFVVVEKKDPQ